MSITLVASYLLRTMMKYFDSYRRDAFIIVMNIVSQGPPGHKMRDGVEQEH